MRRPLSGVELAAEIARLLASRGLYAARHSTSILVMSPERMLASIHVYGRECVMRPYKPYAEDHAGILAELEEELRGLCGSLRIE